MAEAARIQQTNKDPRNSFGMAGSFIEFNRTVKKFAYGGLHKPARPILPRQLPEYLEDREALRDRAGKICCVRWP